MEANLIASIVTGSLAFATAVTTAYNTRKTYQLQLLVGESKTISEGNASAIATVAQLGHENAHAIEHTRVQNVRLESAVAETKVQNAEIAEALSEVHVCVEVRVAEIKESVKEIIPAVINEVVPEIIKEVIPEAIKESLPAVIAAQPSLATAPDPEQIAHP